MQMLDKVKKNYSPLVPQDMTDELLEVMQKYDNIGVYESDE